MRLPRCQRARRVSVCSLSRQLGIGEATTYRLHHGKGETVFVGERVILRCAIVEPEHLLTDVAIKMERLDCNVGAFQSALQETPEVLDAVRMNFAANVFLNVIHGLVDEV